MTLKNCGDYHSYFLIQKWSGRHFLVCVAFPVCPIHLRSPDMFINFSKGERGSLGGRGQPGLTGLKGAKVREPVCGRVGLENDSCVPFKSLLLLSVLQGDQGLPGPRGQPGEAGNPGANVCVAFKIQTIHGENPCWEVCLRCVKDAAFKATPVLPGHGGKPRRLWIKGRPRTLWTKGSVQ